MASVFHSFLIPLWQNGSRYEFIDDLTARYFDEFPPYAASDHQQVRVTRIHRPTMTEAAPFTTPAASLTSVRPRRRPTNSDEMSTRGDTKSELGSSTIMSIAMESGSIDSISCYHPNIGVIGCDARGAVHGRFHPRIPFIFAGTTSGEEGNRLLWRFQQPFSDSPFQSLSPTQGVRFAIPRSQAAYSAERPATSAPLLEGEEDLAGGDFTRDPLSCVPSLVSSAAFGELEIEGVPLWSPFSSPSHLEGSEAENARGPSPSPSTALQRGIHHARQLVGIRLGPIGARFVRITEVHPAEESTLSSSLISGSEPSPDMVRKVASLNLETGFGFRILQRKRVSKGKGKEHTTILSLSDSDGESRNGCRIQCGLQCPLKGESDTLLSATLESSIFRVLLVQTLASSSISLQPGKSGVGRSPSRDREKSNSFSSSSLLQHAAVATSGQLPTMSSIGITVIPNVLQFHAASIWQMRKMDEYELSLAMRLGPVFHALKDTVIRCGTNAQRQLAVGITTCIGNGVQVTLGMLRGREPEQRLKFGFHLQC